MKLDDLSSAEKKKLKAELLQSSLKELSEEHKNWAWVNFTVALPLYLAIGPGLLLYGYANQQPVVFMIGLVFSAFEIAARVIAATIYNLITDAYAEKKLNKNATHTTTKL